MAPKIAGSLSIRTILVGFLNSVLYKMKPTPLEGPHHRIVQAGREITSVWEHVEQRFYYSMEVKWVAI